jgi:ketosteroid isomerase-like protein
VSDIEKALKPEDPTRLFVERSNAGDAGGVADLYEEQAVIAYPPGTQTVGRDAIRELWEKVLANAPHFEQEPPLPTLISGDIALTSTPPKDGAGARAQVAQATGRHLASPARPTGIRTCSPLTNATLDPVQGKVGRIRNHATGARW